MADWREGLVCVNGWIDGNPVHRWVPASEAKEAQEEMEAMMFKNVHETKVYVSAEQREKAKMRESEMIERVARAIAKATGDDPDEFWDVWTKEARAAIEAMREPLKEPPPARGGEG